MIREERYLYFTGGTGMIIIGEKLNSTLKAIRPAIESYDAEAVADLAKKQFEAGSTFIDINAGAFVEDEPERLAWLAKTVQEAIDVPLAIDSADANAIKKALEVNKNPNVMINSITDEPKRYNEVVPLVVEFKTSIVALCMDAGGMPETVKDRVVIAERLIEKLTKEGVAISNIYIDPLVRPISTGIHYGNVAIETIREVKNQFPEVHIACGLSNISFSLPARKLINQAFLVAAIGAGMDGAIIDPLDKKLMSMIYASEALFGKDDYCRTYLKKYRSGAIEA
ncbi:MAG: methyltetrahydrofolate--corrinoid methyltransferase [Bacillota bacterium]|nr:methyltetrahydrofolate--corrinoid methyltransferase [Bacillota bacterium]